MQQNNESNTDNNVGRAVMTDQQLETLRKQIAVFRIISKQLFQTYKTLTASSQTQQDLSLVTLGKTTMLPPSTSGPSQKSKRPRWNPTTTQLQILETIFSKASELPSKQKIKEIADELSHHGLVSETNVYNWFQNKRARSKRKKLLQTTEGDSGDEAVKKGICEEIQVALDETLISPESEAPICRMEELSHEISAELLHFIYSQQPPEVDSMFSNSSATNALLRNITGS